MCVKLRSEDACVYRAVLKQTDWFSYNQFFHLFTVMS